MYSNIPHVRNNLLGNTDPDFSIKQWIRQQPIVLRQWSDSKKVVSYMWDVTASCHTDKNCYIESLSFMPNAFEQK